MEMSLLKGTAVVLSTTVQAFLQWDRHSEAGGSEISALLIPPSKVQSDMQGSKYFSK